MANSEKIIENIIKNDLVNAKKHIHEALLSRLGTVLEEQILEVAPSMINEKKANKDYDGDGKVESGTEEYLGSRDRAIKAKMKKEDVTHEESDIDFEMFVEEVHQIVEEIEEETGEELSDEEIKEIGEEYLQVLRSLNEKYDEESDDTDDDDDDDDDDSDKKKKHKNKKK